MKRIILALVAVLWLCAPASAFTKVQAMGGAAFGSFTTFNVANGMGTFGSPVTSGNTVVCGFWAAVASGDTVTVADTAGNTYNVSSWAISGGAVGLIIAWRGNVTGGPTSVAPTNSNARGNWAGICQEWSAVNSATDPSDVAPAAGLVNNAPGTATNGILSTGVTTTTNGDLLIGMTGNSNVGGGSQSTTCPTSAGTTSITYSLTDASTTFNNAVTCIQMESGVQSTAGAGTVASFTQGTNNGAITYMLALKPPGGGGGGLNGPAPFAFPF